MTKVVGILCEYNVEDLEFHYPVMRLKEEGFDIKKIGPTKDFKGKGKHGLPIHADTAIDDVEASQLDALIIPGGFAPDYWRRDDRILNLVREMHGMNKTIASVCHGPWVLISAKIVKGLNMTCFHAIKDDLENAGALYIADRPVVVDGNIITARIPDDLPEFCKAIIKALN
eukprot:m.65758 g.65758  ORF g.65758 m.65758 type:complete len:171 (-) comp11539_c0_seq1:76-588(-)